MYLQKLITNTQGQHGDTVAYSESFESLKVQYHQTLATMHNAPDVARAVVAILDDYGRALPQFIETVIHTPVPEPEPEETEE